MRARLPAMGGEEGKDPAAYARGLLDALGELGGIDAAGITNYLPLTFEPGSMFRVRRPGAPEEQAVSAFSAVATGEYFRAAGIRIVEGRPFDDVSVRGGDAGDTQGVILDRTLAAALFPEGGAVGSTIERFAFRQGAWVWVSMPVKGVAESVMARGARNEAYPAMYRDFWEVPTPNLAVVARTSAEPAARMDALRAAALAVDPEIAPFGMQTMREMAAGVIAADRALALVCGGFSLVALLLAGLGLYGLVARQINLKRRELGIRLALGARPGELVGSLARVGLVIGSVSLLVGVPASLLASRILEATLFRVRPTDPLSLLAGCGGVMLLCWLAAWLPARRAARVSVVESLATE